MDTQLRADLNYHETRFQFDTKREILWKILCECYFSKLVKPDFHVLELGAGYANFVNNVHCAQRTAVDQWEMLPHYVQPGVTAKVGSVTDLGFLANHSVDFVFASNLFEHLTQREFGLVLDQLKRKAKPGATLNIVQPNYRRAYKEYFDDYTHVSVYSHISLCDFLEANGCRVIQCDPGLLPFSIKSRLPVWPWLIRLYLLLPWRPMAKQMFVRAELG